MKDILKTGSGILENREMSVEYTLFGCKRLIPRGKNKHPH